MLHKCTNAQQYTHRADVTHKGRALLAHGQPFKLRSLVSLTDTENLGLSFACGVLKRLLLRAKHYGSVKGMAIDSD